MFLAFWESIGIQRPQTRQISWHGVTQTFETMEAYDSCQVEEETMQSWLVMAHKPQAILSQATGIMADSFRMKTASDNNTLKVPNWRYSRYTWLTCSFLCHPLMLFYLVWPWMFVCVCATGVEVDLQCTDVASLFYVLSFFVFLHLYACCLKTSGLYTACQDSSMDHMSYEPCQCELYLFFRGKNIFCKSQRHSAPYQIWLLSAGRLEPTEAASWNSTQARHIRILTVLFGRIFRSSVRLTLLNPLLEADRSPLSSSFLLKCLELWRGTRRTQLCFQQRWIIGFELMHLESKSDLLKNTANAPTTSVFGQWAWG